MGWVVVGGGGGGGGRALCLVASVGITSHAPRHALHRDSLSFGLCYTLFFLFVVGGITGNPRKLGRGGGDSSVVRAPDS